MTETSELIEEDLTLPTVSGRRMLFMQARLNASLERNKAFVEEITALKAELVKTHLRIPVNDVNE